jgi:hypothetical protein
MSAFRRQVRRLARRYAATGSVGLITKRFSRPSKNRLDDETADRGINWLMDPAQTAAAKDSTAHSEAGGVKVPLLHLR